ncbi:MAG: alpha-amylase family glycosyl hydrolase [Elusimicrobia bacterium]|nr:alpha-amylase family glycosyl hydrolase [Elusimicrobiota bacterium]
MNKTLLAVALAIATGPAVNAVAAAEAQDWRDQVVYFLMTDRFADGDSSNNDQKAGEFSPSNGELYSGGDLAGVRSKLDYIQGLGATTVWLTPPVSNVWYDPALKMAGYHGYWAADFRTVDAHLGTLEDYRGLASDLHGRGMLLIQDIVVNHTGDFFSYAGPCDPADPAKNFRLKTGMIPTRPAQYPFSMNDAGSAEARRTAAYHWTPDISDFNDASQLTSRQVSGLDDINTSSPLVRSTLKNTYDRWIKAAGVDGFRIDTAKYVEHEFLRDFIHSADPAAPGVQVFASGEGKKDFLTLGEVWTNVTPFEDKEDALAASYLGTAEKPEMNAVLNFPLAWDLRAVFAKGAPPAMLKYRLESMARRYPGGRASANFIDNHDMPRFLSEGGEAGLEQALTALFTLPGTPVIYAGTEQGFTETRASLFAGGFGSGGKDHFDTSHRLYVLLRRLADLRRGQPALRKGTLTPLYGQTWGPGPLAYRVDPSSGSAGRLSDAPVLVVFNTAEEEMLAPAIMTGLPEGTRFETLFGSGAGGADIRIGKAGRLFMRLPARSTVVLKALPSEPAIPGNKKEFQKAAVSIAKVRGGSIAAADGWPSATPGKADKVTVWGNSSGAGSVSVVVDGRISRMVPALTLPDGRWSAELDGGVLPDGEHSLVAMGTSGAAFAWSQEWPLAIDLPYVLAAVAEDPVGDDHGPAGRYHYPLASGFEGRADIKSLALYRRGSAAKLVITLANGISDVWNPAFGFDHVCLDIYLDFPESGPRGKGLSVLPRLNASMREGMDWDFAAFVSGWKVGLYGTGGSTADGFGPTLSPAPRVRADKKAGSVEVEFSPDAFKGVSSFDGARFYVTTWDYDGVEGGLRPLAKEPADFVFGGGEPGGPRIMDDASIP